MFGVGLAGVVSAGKLQKQGCEPVSPQTKHKPTTKPLTSTLSKYDLTAEFKELPYNSSSSA